MGCLKIFLPKEIKFEIPFLSAYIQGGNSRYFMEKAMLLGAVLPFLSPFRGAEAAEDLTYPLPCDRLAAFRAYYQRI